MEYSGHYIVIGPPGTGKTTFLAKQVKTVVEKGYRPLVCSLTRTAANEIAGRDLPVERNMVGTLHSLAYRTTGHDLKLVNIAQWNQEHPHLALTVDTKHRGETNHDDLLNAKVKKSGDAVYQRYELLRHQCRDRDFWPATVQEFAKLWEAWKFENDYLDFTDMIEHAIKFSGQATGQPDIVIGDELQDFSRLEYNLLKKWGERAGAMIGCGDGFQSLYTWRGADPTIFNDPSVPDDHRRILKQSYRVPKSVQNAALSWIGQLSDFSPVEYAPRDYDGSVEFCEANRKYPQPIVNLARKYIAAGKTVMILATCGYLLTPTLKLLREQGIPFANPWRPHHGGWNPLLRRKGTGIIDRIEALLRMDGNATENPRPWTVQEFVEWSSVLAAESLFVRGGKRAIEKEIADGLDPDANWSVLKEHVDTQKLAELGTYLQQCKTTEAVTWWWRRMTGKRAETAQFPVRVLKLLGLSALQKIPSLYIGTIHSFKGGEADIVFIYPDLSPQGYKEWIRGGAYRDPIIRAFYVALTRARESVYLCEPSGPMTVKL